MSKVIGNGKDVRNNKETRIDKNIRKSKDIQGKIYPRVLVVSYNCFSLSVSTGRTLANLFWGWEKKSIAQLFMSNEIPDNDVCLKYYRVTDMDVINALRMRKTSRVIHLQRNGHKNDQDDAKEKALYHKLKEMKQKNKVKMKFFRSILWSLGLWKSDDYFNWLDRFQPELLMVMAGENYFVDKVGLEISKRFNIPLVVYNCENYQFKDYSRRGIYGVLFQRSLNRSFYKLVSKASHVIFANQPLMKLFQKRYSMNASVIYISSILDNCYMDNPKNTLRISYLGNIDGRYESLIEIAKSIKNIDCNLSLDVYGNIKSSFVKHEIENCSQLNYFGFVSYYEVIKIISESDILVHCESFDRDEIIDKWFAFSTKIGDSLASGSCLFVYGPKSNAAVKYLNKSKAACVVTEKVFLEKELKNLIHNDRLRATYRKNALKLAKENHDIYKNAHKVYEIISRVINEG